MIEQNVYEVVKLPTKQKKRTVRQLKANKTKQKSISQLIKFCDSVFSKKVREKGAWLQGGELWNRSFTTPSYTAPIRKLHCGHYLSRFYKSARWDFDNARPQSMMDNLWKRGDPIVFRQNLIKEIGEERVLAVESKRNVSIKLTREYLEALLATLSK